jgi:hypothetical protein
MHLSKSLYIRGLQCTKSLWLKLNNPSLLSPEDSSRFETGNKVGLLARQLFPSGKEIKFLTPTEQIKKTQEYINSGIKTIYEATFEFEDVLVMVDILHVVDDGLNIYEVKSSSKVKQTHLNDLSIQYYVLLGLGFHIKSSNIVCINNKYIREESLNLNELFQINEVTDKIITLQKKIPGNLVRLKTPDIQVDIGKYCTSPYKCDAYDYCWQHIPENSIFNITELGIEKKMKLYSQGIKTFDQIEDFSNFNKRQMIQIQSELYIDEKAVHNFLKGLTYPLYHLDFESYQQAIPEWPGVSPYTQMPFQYSLHIEQENGDLEHREFLANEGEDPRAELAKRLVNDIPDNVTILAYNMKFEKGIIKSLAYSFPQYADRLMAMNDNVKDLMPIFKNKQYYTPAMRGRYSIKYVLPALVPEMAESYKELDGIHNGMDAMTIFPKLMDMDENERQKYRTALLKYCELDTLAMVKILEVLKSV